MDGLQSVPGEANSRGTHGTLDDSDEPVAGFNFVVSFSEAEA